MKKQLSAFWIALALIFSLCPVRAHSVSAVPSGYTAITTAQQLSDIRNHLSGKYILMNNIDVTSLNWTAIGYNANGSTAFTGILDGNGYFITGLDTASHDPKTALFWTNGGTLRNLTITGTHKSYAVYTGVFCHYNTGTIQNCHNKATLTHMKGISSGLLYVGGIAGNNTGTIQYCSNQADFSSDTSRYGSGDMTVYIGGIAGINSGIIRECWNSGSLSARGNGADPFIGGIAGVSGANAQFINCYNTGTLYASSGASTNAWNIGAGGILGHSDNKKVIIATCYNRGSVSLGYSHSAKFRGGLVGLADSNLKFSNCYFLESGTLTAISGKTSVSGATVLTASQMMTAANFVGFDFSNTWKMSTYPVLGVGCTHLVEYVPAKEPSCASDGNIAYYYCNICVKYFTSSGKGTQLTKAETILPGGHRCTDKVSDVLASEATCTAGPVYYLLCDNCGTVSDEYTLETGAPLGHSYGEWVITQETTCTNDGMKRQDCLNCDHYVEEVIATPGHSNVSVVTDPTCTEDGYTTHTCSVCQAVSVDSFVPAKGHTYGTWYTTLEPTCTEDGQERHDCTECDHYETNVLTAPGHRYESVVTAPTCDDGGYTTYTCSCGASYQDDYLPATGHTYGSWYVVNEATCTEDGRERRDCLHCNYYNTRVLDATGHSYGDWYTVTAATCLDDGLERRNCSRCDTFLTNTLPATGHDYETVVTAPTCTEHGFTVCTCANCDDSYVADSVDPLGHSFADGTCIRCGVVLGDVNHDGRIDTIDAYLVTMYHNQKMAFTAGQLAAADVNGNGTVDAIDAYYILLFYNEKIAKFPG